MRRLLPLLALCAAACQPLPHPFAADVPPAALLSPRDSAGIYVAPVAGASPIAGDLAEAMAKALRDADIPASTHARTKGSYELRGAAREQALPDDRVAVSVDWELLAADGSSLGHAPVSTEQPTAASDTVAPTLAAAAAPAIRKLVQDEPPAAAAHPDPAVSLRPVTGAPGDGKRSLTRAMEQALRQARVALAKPGDDAPAFVLTGTVTMSPADSSKQQHVRIGWALLRGDGSEIGQVSQENAVPAGSLDGAWGDVAYAVATAAAPGVVALIQRAKAQAIGS